MAFTGVQWCTTETIDYSLVREQKYLRAFSLVWASEKFMATLIPCQCVHFSTLVFLCQQQS